MDRTQSPANKKERKQRMLCVQFQPPGTSKLRLEAVAAIMFRLAVSESSILRFTFERDKTDKSWVNFYFTGRSLGPIWKELHKRVLNDSRLGAGIRKSTIVICEGSRGWENYRLLHHFDESQKLDRLAGI